MLSSLLNAMTEMLMWTFNFILDKQLFLLQIINIHHKEDQALNADDTVHDELMIVLLQLQQLPMLPPELKITLRPLFVTLQPKMQL